MKKNKFSGHLEPSSVLSPPASETWEVRKARLNVIRQLNLPADQMDARKIADGLNAVIAEQKSDGLFITDPVMKMSIIDALAQHKKHESHQLLVDHLSGHIADVMHEENRAEKKMHKREQQWADRARRDFDAKQAKSL